MYSNMVIYFSDGVYSKSPAILTIAPSMDISISSNFERYLFYLCGEDANLLNAWMTQFERSGRLAVSSNLHARASEDFLSFASNKENILQTMTDLYKAEK